MILFALFNEEVNLTQYCYWVRWWSSWMLVTVSSLLPFRDHTAYEQCMTLLSLVSNHNLIFMVFWGVFKLLDVIQDWIISLQISPWEFLVLKRLNLKFKVLGGNLAKRLIFFSKSGKGFDLHYIHNFLQNH